MDKFLTEKERANKSIVAIKELNEQSSEFNSDVEWRTNE